MKSIVQTIIFNAVGLYFLTLAIPAIHLAGEWKTYIVTAIALALLNLLVRPIINIVLLPVNVLTLGTFRWLTNVIILWLTTKFISQLTIGAFYFPGFSYQGAVLPPMLLTPFWTLVVGAFLLSLATSILNWLADR